jgi:hypothetical protein
MRFTRERDRPGRKKILLARAEQSRLRLIRRI